MQTRTWVRDGMARATSGTRAPHTRATAGRAARFTPRAPHAAAYLVRRLDAIRVGGNEHLDHLLGGLVLGGIVQWQHAILRTTAQCTRACG